MAKGYSQKEGVDYDKTFAPVAKYTSIKVVISIAAEMGWKIHQMDMTTTFLMASLRRCILSSRRVLKYRGRIPTCVG